MATVRRLAFGPQVCGRIDEGAEREWLVPDGLGGYAMGTVSGLRTRRYHGLLIVAGDNPARRQLGLASLDPVVTSVPTGEDAGELWDHIAWLAARDDFFEYKRSRR